jgi:tRNA threonylcarbamoyladenosine biosynthesis protein TsaB
VLAESGITLKQLDAIAFGRGPGSFTGIRIAAGVVQGIALACDLPVVPVSTLAAMANAVHRQSQATHVVPMIDARMQEVYWACYVFEHGRAILAGEEKVSRPNDVVIPRDIRWMCAGSGWQKYAADIRAQNSAILDDFPDALFPSAHDVALLAATAFVNGEAVPPEQALPVYLRDQVTHSVPV